MALRNIWSFAATVTILVTVPGFVLSQLATIDNVIAEAANSSKDFEFYYDLGHQDVRVELDMLFSGAQWSIIQSSSSGINKRKAIIPGPKGMLWTNGEIPYDFAPYTFNEFQIRAIMEAMKEWERYSCLMFRQATNADINKIVFKNGGGCYSRVGMFGGAQDVALAQPCRQKRIVIHELGHVLGLHHEQTRPDRDGYVRIIERNIAPRMLFNFDRHSWNVIQDYGVPYDYYSIMHYGQTAFSMNNRITMQTTDPRYQNVIGMQPGLSFWDIKTINLMYPCVSSCNRTSTDCPAMGFLGKDCRCWCPGGAPYRICNGTETQVPAPSVIDNGGVGVVQPCSDSNMNCRSWAGAGHCLNPLFTAFMSAYCRLSCQRCGVVQPCSDSNMNCRSWAGAGHCTNPSYTAFMSDNCRLSCQRCGGGGTSNPAICQNLDMSGDCDVWAQTGLCHKVPDFMLKQCQRSCNICTVASVPPFQPLSPPRLSTISPLPPLPSTWPPPLPSSLPPLPSSLPPLPSSLAPLPSSLPPLPSSLPPLPPSLPPLPSSLPLLPPSLPSLPPTSSTCMDHSLKCLYLAETTSMCETDLHFMFACCPLSCGFTWCADPSNFNSLATYCNIQYGYGYGRKRKK